jgi:hypothetical protein
MFLTWIIHCIHNLNFHNILSTIYLGKSVFAVSQFKGLPMNSELEDYFDDLFLFFLYVCIISGVQQNRRFEVYNLGYLKKLIT